MQRNIIQYHAYQSVNIVMYHASMTGFLFRGARTRSPNITVPCPQFKNKVSIKDNLAYEAIPSRNVWYALFAVANDKDTVCKFVCVPFLRASKVEGKKFYFGDAGENQASGEKQMNWKMEPKNVECLVISEKIDDRSHAFSGRLTRVVVQCEICNVGR